MNPSKKSTAMFHIITQILQFRPIYARLQNIEQIYSGYSQMESVKMVPAREVRNLLGFDYRPWHKFLATAKTPRKVKAGSTLLFAGPSARKRSEEHTYELQSLMRTPY